MSFITQWPRFRSSFQFKLFITFSLLTVLITSPLCFLYIYSETQENRHLASEFLKLRTQQLADAARLPLYAENGEVLRQLADQAAQVPEVRSVTITAPDGRVLIDVHSRKSNRDSTAPVDVIHQSVAVYSNPLADSVESSLAGAKDATMALIGTVRMERGTDDLSRTAWHLGIVAVSSAFFFWLLVSTVSFLVLRRVTNSFTALMHGIETMKEGNYTSRIDSDVDDEPGRAADAINNLAIVLQRRGEENTRLQHERLDLERQMLHTQKLESLGIMAGGIAHDFNNLLQSILGNMELASRKLEPDSEPSKYIASALNSGRHAAHLTGLMLTYAGKGFITKKALSLNELVRDNSEMLKTAVSPAVAMELRLAAALPAIKADKAQMQQVVMNLITNAAESCEGQPGRIVLTTGTEECDQTCLSASLLDEKPEPGQYVFLEVRDNGCGMSEDTLKRLFDPFFTTKFTGRGLGMSAVMGIIKTHCGALFVDSAPGKGTTFKVLFPMTGSALPDNLQPLLPSAPSTPYDFSFNGPLGGHLSQERKEPQSIPESGTTQDIHSSGTALVVDDEKPVLRVCTKMVKLCGFTVITACDGVDAVAKFRDNADAIDVVVMDLTMPNMDGITAMAEMYRLRPDIKIILSSGFSEDELSERITGKAPSGFICKPYSLNVLETELLRIMRAE